MWEWLMAIAAAVLARRAEAPVGDLETGLASNERDRFWDQLLGVTWIDGF